MWYLWWYASAVCRYAGIVEYYIYRHNAKCTLINRSTLHFHTQWYAAKVEKWYRNLLKYITNHLEKTVLYELKHAQKIRVRSLLFFGSLVFVFNCNLLLRCWQGKEADIALPRRYSCTSIRCHTSRIPHHQSWGQEVLCCLVIWEGWVLLQWCLIILCFRRGTQSHLSFPLIRRRVNYRVVIWDLYKVKQWLVPSSLSLTQDCYMCVIR